MFDPRSARCRWVSASRTTPSRLPPNLCRSCTAPAWASGVSRQHECLPTPRQVVFPSSPSRLDNERLRGVRLIAQLPIKTSLSCASSEALRGVDSARLPPHVLPSCVSRLPFPVWATSDSRVSGCVPPFCFGNERPRGCRFSTTLRQLPPNLCRLLGHSGIRGVGR